MKEDPLKRFPSAEYVKKYKNASKAQRRWAVEWLIKSALSYQDINGIKNFAREISYSLTNRQKERIIEKLVYTAENALQLANAKAYASSESLLHRYVKARLSKKFLS